MQIWRIKNTHYIILGLLFLVLGHSPLEAATRSEVKRMIIQEAQNSRVPSELALAVAKVESDFLADALSTAGARGVMQIMPATAKDEFGVNRDELWNARLNVQLGIDYLERLYDLYGGRWDLALSHYNGGSLNKSGSNAKPHNYTRKYVANVLKWQARYSEQARIWQVASGNQVKGKWMPARTKVGSMVESPRYQSIVVRAKPVQASPSKGFSLPSYYNSHQLKEIFFGAKFDLSYKCSAYGDLGNAVVSFRTDGDFHINANCVGNSLIDSFDENSDGTWGVVGKQLCMAFNGSKLTSYSRSNSPNTAFTKGPKCWRIKRGRFGFDAFDKTDFKDWRASLISHPKYISQKQLYVAMREVKNWGLERQKTYNSSRIVVQETKRKGNGIYIKAKEEIWKGDPNFEERLRRARIALADVSPLVDKADKKSEL